MKNLILVCAAALSLTFTAVLAADYDKGLAAAKNGDFVSALEEWKPLADQGDARAQSDLGLMYFNGQGVPQDPAEAAKWFRLAADQGNAMAQSNLGWMYSEGDGVVQDYAEAAKWFSLAAEQGYAESQYKLGWMYQRGEGVSQSYSMAFVLGTIAAANGYNKGPNLLGFAKSKLTSDELSKAKKMANECISNNYKNCGF